VRGRRRRDVAGSGIERRRGVLRLRHRRADEDRLTGSPRLEDEVATQVDERFAQDRRDRQRDKRTDEPVDLAARG